VLDYLCEREKAKAVILTKIVDDSMKERSVFYRRGVGVYGGKGL